MKKQKTEKMTVSWTRQQILEAARFADRADLLRALLEEGKEYTTADVDSLIDQFMKGKVI